MRATEARPGDAAASDVTRRELCFHDDWAQSIDPSSVAVEETFSACTSPEPQWLFAQMGDIRGKRLLELGSGAGEGAVFFAKRGAQVTATDLSHGMLEVVRKVAALHGTQVDTQVCSAEDLSAFRDGSFDVVYAANLLHHVDIRRCLDEVKRVLKPGGVAAFWDPMAHNPAINVYRRMAAPLRTADEHPLRRKELRWFRQRFPEVRTRFFWLTTLLVFLKFYLVDRVHPSADRYWKRILTHERSLRWLYRPLQALDTLLLAIAPPLGWYCWNICIFVRKDGDGE
ncbi:MAG: class I SAM-dependent methyltransferase [Candidatus Nitricoxidivorans perseverans]|uniref:Class I SAM-dependent methyltransferase n=1 Tax=Candidatus Nitricoxidivorans perseverans TaxID=2975601 RepID=A0AA49FKA0_9PROT|nr:MAG: class I SAM-dependent methyltransferase [Candidatus Nitricoxidivorans perseverans]